MDKKNSILKKFIAGGILISALLPFVARAEILYLNPTAARIGPGDTFQVTVRINPEGECVNAGQIDISFAPASLRVVDFSTGGSIFSIWTEVPGEAALEKANTDGLLTFSGGIPAGYCGNINNGASEANLLGKIIFKVPELSVAGPNAATSTEISIAGTSQLYANDGMGSIVPFTSQNANFTILPTGQKTQNIWRAEIKSDSTPPEQFRIEIGKDENIFDGKYFIMFSAIDLQTGVDHYEIFESPRKSLPEPGHENWKEGTSPYLLEDQTMSSIIKVRAVDKAGNATMAVYQPESARKIFSVRDQLLVLLAFAMATILIGQMVYRFIARKK